jgi:very-short-patch-repair endonuclease
VLRAIGSDVEGRDLQPQVTIADERGRGQVDLAARRLRWAIEADSYTWHGDRPAFVRDCRRYTRLVLLGWRVLRFVWEDVMHNPAYVRECL